MWKKKYVMCIYYTRFEVYKAVKMWTVVFWIVTPCDVPKGSIASSTLKMEAIRSSLTPITTYKTTQGKKSYHKSCVDLLHVITPTNLS
jgi:hypothetical protein